MNNSNSNKAKEKSKDLLLEIYGGKSFCKIYQALGIGKIKFSFAEKGKETEGIDCYVNVDDFVSNFISKIRNRDFLRLADAERKRAKDANEQYCKPIWQSRIGLSSDSNLRHFSLQPGSSTEFVFRAVENKSSIIVGFDYRELELLEYRWKFLEKDWNDIMAKKYSFANMKDENKEKFYSKQVMEMEEAESEESAPAKQDNPPVNEEKASPTERPMFKATGTDTSEKQEENGKQQEAIPPSVKLRLKVTKEVARASSGNACLKAITEDGTEYILIFSKTLMNNVPNWAEYEKKLGKAGTIISITGKIYGERISVEEVS